ncbi:MAG: hypothetical protein R6W88_13795 [Desulfobacterales bacterium]
MRGNLKENLFKYPEKTLQTVLGLVAVHSIVMGLVLIIQPAVLMELSGFSGDYEHFFPAQGGVFHLLMSVVYLTGATNIEKYQHFIVFSIFVKAVATFFLTMYCFAAEFKWIVLLSGIADCMMGLIIFWALQHYLRSKKRTALGRKNG